MSHLWKKFPRTLLLLTLCSLTACVTREIPVLISGGLIEAPKAKVVASESGESRLMILSENDQAFHAILALSDVAKSSIDLQYYLFFKDGCGLIVRDRLIRAATRGVKVRILVDETGLLAVQDEIRLMNSHPNIEVRFFNPLGGKYLGPARIFNFLYDPLRLNRRMHNKLFAVDGKWVITGGRNVGDHYFTSASESYFKDLDILANGKLAKQSHEMFEKYWNCDVSVPVEHYFTGRKRPRDDKKLRKLQLEIQQNSEVKKSISKYESSDWKKNLLRDTLPWTPSKAKLIYDEPSKIKALATESEHLLMGAHLTEVALSSKEEVFIVSPYFIPGTDGVEFLTKIAKSGVKVRLLTNSLASTDVAIVHGGYMRYREDLLKAGVEIYELKPNASLKKRWKRSSPSSRASLHAKTFVFDGKKVFVGSYNVDPRSANLNTEMGVLAENKNLSQQVKQLLHEAIQPEASYRVVLNKKGRVEWHCMEQGKPVIFRSEPKAKTKRKISSFWGYWLPIENQL